MSEMNNQDLVVSLSGSTTWSMGEFGRGQNWSWDTENLATRKIHIDIAGPDGVIVTFYVPIHMPMHKILKKYCKERIFDYLSMEFYLKGRRLHRRNTVDELHLEEGEQIDAFIYSPGA